MNYNELNAYIDSSKIDDLLKKIICSDDIKDEKKRYHIVLDELHKDYNDGDFHFVSSPGRVEIGGNHTDHQHGHVVAATISYDNVCVFAKTNDKLDPINTFGSHTALNPPTLYPSSLSLFATPLIIDAEVFFSSSLMLVSEISIDTSPNL